MTRVECPVDGCRELHQPEYPMCKPHWLSLPSYVRSELNRTQGTDEYDRAVAQAISSANDQASEPLRLEDATPPQEGTSHE